MPKSRIYLAYGSNLNLAQMAQRCPTAKVLGTATLKGYELLFRGKPDRGVANIEPRDGAFVPALLWKLRPQDEASLDGYEVRYAKHMVEAELGGRPVRAMTYVMMPGFEASLPSPEYLHRIEDGYTSAGLDPAVLLNALDHTEEIMAQEMYGQMDGPDEEMESLFDMKWGW